MIRQTIVRQFYFYRRKNFNFINTEKARFDLKKQGTPSLSVQRQPRYVQAKRSHYGSKISPKAVNDLIKLSAV